MCFCFILSISLFDDELQSEPICFNHGINDQEKPATSLVFSVMFDSKSCTSLSFTKSIAVKELAIIVSIIVVNKRRLAKNFFFAMIQMKNL